MILTAAIFCHSNRIIHTLTMKKYWISPPRSLNQQRWRWLVPFRAPVVVVALNHCCGFLEADVIESGKRCAADVFDCVVGDQELLLEASGAESGRSYWDSVPDVSCVTYGSSSIYTVPHLPPHENIVRVLQVLVVKIIRVERLCILVEGLELALHPWIK